MQMCFIGLTSCRVSTPQGSIAEVPKDEMPLAKQRRLHSEPIHRLDDVYNNAIRHLGNPKGSDTGKCEDESRRFDNSLELRAMRSSAPLSTRTTNLIDGALSRSPSFKDYLKNEDSNLNENQDCSPIHRLTIKDVLSKTDADFLSPFSSSQQIDTSKSVLSNKKLGRGPGPRKKEKGWKFRLHTKKNKDSRPHQCLSRETAVVMLQKVIRGFLLRKHLKILRNIDAIAEDFGKQLAKYGEILVCDGLQNKIVHLLSQINSVRVAMVYKRKVLQKVISLQKTVSSIASGTCKLDSDTIVKKSGVVVDSNELIMKSFSFPKLQLNRVVKTGSSMEEAPSDRTYSIRVSDNDKINENIDWDPFEEDDIVIDFQIPSTQNSTFRIEENMRVEAVNLIEEPAIDGQETEGAREDTMKEKVNLDPIEMQKGSDTMLEWDKLKKQLQTFDQKDDASSTEETPFECICLTKTTEIEEIMRKSSNSDKKITEKKLNSNEPAMETMDEVCDPIKCKKLLNTIQMLQHHKEFGDNTLESSQLEMYRNQTEEKEIKGLKEILEGLKELSTESNEIKTLMKELENSVQELGKKLLRIERKENINITKFERKCNSFS